MGALKTSFIAGWRMGVNEREITRSLEAYKVEWNGETSVNMVDHLVHQ